jgi:Lrp/AsnC family leucine-responsive transcriptional regulator
MSIDEIDLRILDMLQRNGKLSQARIAGAVGLTTPSVNERIKKMERHGMIKGFVALLDHEKMGLPLTAYVDVALEHPRFEKGFVDELEKLLGVQECHYLAGDFAYRLKVKAADTAALADFLQRRISTIKGVVRVQAQISLSSKKESTLLPLMPEKEREKEKEATVAGEVKK